MNEQAVVAESSPVTAPVMDVSRGPLVDITPEQRAEFRRTGELPTKELPKTGDSATSSEAKPEKEIVETAGESETPEKQEKAEAKPKPQTAKERIAQLEATIEKIRKDAGLKKTEQAESSPAKPEPKPVQQQPRAEQEPTIDDLNPDGTPKFKNWEEFNKAQARWEVRQELAEIRRNEAEQEQAKEFNSRVAEAESRYENFKEVVAPFAFAMNQDPTVNPAVKQMFLDSDVLPDLLYAIANNREDQASFLKMAKETPGKAIRYVALTESLIAEELEGKKAKPEEAPPVKPKTQAPRPPSEAGGRAAAPPDALEAAAKANNFRDFKVESLRRDLAKLKT